MTPPPRESRVDTAYTLESGAGAYPGPDLGYSYLLAGERIIPLRETPCHRVDYYTIADGNDRGEALDVFLDRNGWDLVCERFPVVAFGSNRNPNHLWLRFNSISSCAIPVITASLRGAAVVFPAHISSYGVVTSTLKASPATESSVHLLFLDREQLDALHEAEKTGRNFRLAYLTECTLTLPSGERIDSPCSFIGQHQVARPNGTVARLAAVRAESPIPALSLADVMVWLLQVARSAGRLFSDQDELQAFARESETNREWLRALMKADPETHGLSLEYVGAVADTRPVPLSYRRLDSRLSMEPAPDLLVDETSGSQRVAGSYTVTITPTLARELGVRAGGLVAVENCFTMRRPDEPLRLRALAHVVEEKSTEAQRAGMDKTLRTALAVRVGDGVYLRRAVLTASDRIRERVGSLLRAQYVYCRVQKTHYPDMEKPVCRLPREALDVLGASHGGRVIVQGLVQTGKQDYSAVLRNLKVLEADDGVLDERKAAAEGRFTAYYADCNFLLGVNRDVYPIFLDKQVRDETGGDICGVVRVRRSSRNALSEETLSLLLIFLGSLIGLAPGLKGKEFLGASLSLLAGVSIVLFGLALVLYNVRKRTP